MGIISDIFEDNQENIGRLIDKKLLSKIATEATEKKSEKLTWFACPLCNDCFSSNQSLQNHIFERHRGTYVYVRVNDRVFCHSLIWVSEPLQHLSIHFSGTELPRLVMRVKVHPDDQIKQIIAEPLHYRNLEELLPSLFPYRISLEIPGRQGFEIYFSKQELVDSSALDALIADVETELIRDLQNVNWQKWSSCFSRAAKNDMEQNYLRGHYDYLFAYWLECAERKPREAADHYVNAFGKLYIFAHHKAAIVCRVIAFKMNWFDMFQHIDKASKFFLPTHFYMHPYEEIISLRKNYSTKNYSTEKETFFPDAKSRSVQVLVDDFHVLVINAVRHFYYGEDDLLFSILQRLQCDFMSDFSRNYRDKLLLLLARYHRLRGNVKQAFNFYDQLRYQYPFDKEAQEFEREQKE